MTELLRLSVLDQSPVAEGSTGSQALRNTIDLARLTDRLGYHRYWVAEHHGGPSLAGPSPEVLIGPIASATERMRVGSGGVMLPHYWPLKVAQSFSVLAGLYPGRIDLGIGRAAGTDPMTTFALQRDRRQAAPDDFPQQLAELLAYFDDSFPDGHALARYVAHAPRPPGDARAVAARLLRPERDLGRRARPALRVRRLHQPRRRRDRGPVPRALHRLAPPRRAAHRGRRVGAVRRHRRGGAPARGEQPDDVHAPAPGPPHPGPAARQGAALPRDPKASPAAGRRRRSIVGTPETVRAGIVDVAAQYGAEEAIVVTITYDHEARRRSYELIAEAFDLSAAPSAAAGAPA